MWVYSNLLLLGQVLLHVFDFPQLLCSPCLVPSSPTVSFPSPPQGYGSPQGYGMRPMGMQQQPAPSNPFGSTQVREGERRKGRGEKEGKGREGQVTSSTALVRHGMPLTPTHPVSILMTSSRRQEGHLVLNSMLPFLFKPQFCASVFNYTH